MTAESALIQWQEEVVNDIFEAAIQDGKLALLYEINKTNFLAVKTQHGLSERRAVVKILCQWDSIQCSLQIDTIDLDSLAKDLKPFKYKGEVETPALGMVDDILEESGFQTARLNSFITAKIALKKLQLGPKTCVV